jgi:hypothetical protein
MPGYIEVNLRRSKLSWSPSRVEYIRQTYANYISVVDCYPGYKVGDYLRSEIAVRIAYVTARHGENLWMAQY